MITFPHKPNSESVREKTVGAVSEQRSPYDTCLRQGYPNRVLREHAVKSFCVMRVPRFQEIINEYHGRGTLSHARGSEKAQSRTTG
jgi:hypothetical protein